jgi:hypothetical protein
MDRFAKLVLCVDWKGGEETMAHEDYARNR